MQKETGETRDTNVLDGVSKEDLKKLLLKSWMTHDAMWFANALQRDGIETANALNLGAIRSMAPFEVRRLREILHVGDIEDQVALRRFLEATMALMADDYMDFQWDWREDGSVQVTARRCFAFEGISKLGAIADYQCGIFERIYAWLDALGVDYDVDHDGKECMMHHSGACQRQLTFRFDS